MRSVFPLLALACLLVGCSERGTETTPVPGIAKVQADRVRLVLNWFPESQHGGFYAAKVHGIFAIDGLDVEIIPGGVDVPVVPRVATGQVEFGILNADDLVFGRLAGADVVALMAPMQVSPRIIMVHEESGFETIGDIRNVTLAMNAANPFAQFIQARFPLEGVRVVPYGGSIAPFIANRNFAVQGYSFSEPLIAIQAGANPRSLFVADAGFNPYTSMLVTRRALINSNPDLVRRMTRSSILGWARYMEDPTETNAVIGAANPEMTPEILSFSVEAMQPLIFAGDAVEGNLGIMTYNRWSELIQTMEEIGSIEAGRVHPDDAFTTTFISPLSDLEDN